MRQMAIAVLGAVLASLIALALLNRRSAHEPFTFDQQSSTATDATGVLRAKVYAAIQGAHRKASGKAASRSTVRSVADRMLRSDLPIGASPNELMELASRTMSA